MLLFHIDLPESDHLLDHDEGKQKTEADHHRNGFPIIRKRENDRGQLDQASDQETEKTDKGIPVFTDISASEIYRQGNDPQNSQDHQNDIGHIDQMIKRHDPGKMKERPDNGIQYGDHHCCRHASVFPIPLHRRQIDSQRQRHHQTEHKTQKTVHMIYPEDKRKHGRIGKDPCRNGKDRQRAVYQIDLLPVEDP